MDGHYPSQYNLYKTSKSRGCAPRGCRTIINKQEGVTLYQKTRNTRLLIPSPLRTFGKKTDPTGVTPTMLLWFLPAQNSIHDLWNTKQMANKTNPYWENRPGCSLPPDKRKHDNRVDMHCNSQQASLYLPEINFWHQTWTRGIYECYWSGNRPRQRSTPGWILGRRWSKLATPILTPAGGEKEFTNPSFNGKPLSSGHHSHWGVNGCIHQWHHHHNVQWRTLDKSRRKCSSIGHPYTITITTAIRTPETRRSTLLRKLVREVQLSEKKTCLGWDINIHSLKVFLIE